MLTVLQIIPRLGLGGAEQSCEDVAKGLVRAGHRALVVSEGGPRVAALEAAGVTHWTLPAASKNPLTILRNAAWLHDHIRAEKVDILHARSRAPAWSGWMACQDTPCRFMTTFHAAYAFSNPLKKAYNAVMARGERVIAVSGFVAEHIRTHYPSCADRVRIIPRGLDLAAFNPAAITEERRAALRALWKVEPGATILLAPARPSPIKGQTLLLEALARLDPFPDTLIAVFPGAEGGRSSTRDAMDSLIRTHGLEQRVRIAPPCADMPAAYSLAALAAVPSQVPEGFGRVPIEAMAMGVPVLGSDLGALRETILPDATGWLLPPNAPEDWARTLRAALALPSARRAEMGAAARARATSLYGVEKMVAATLAAYAEIAGLPA